MAEQSLIITTPVGRLVAGSLYTPVTTDFEGKPLTLKDKVTPRSEISFGVAFPKTPGVTHWSQEPAQANGKPWLADIWAFGHSQFPGGEAQRGDFAWKIQDGDSTIPNKRGNKNADKEGYPGHWILFFTSGYAPAIWNANATQQILEEGAVKRGFYVQVCGSITKNTGASPGLYFNHSMVALSGFGPEISSGPDVSTAGFGGVPLPPGASTIPVAGMNPPPPPAAPAAPAYTPPPAPTVAVAPNPGILTPPPPPAAPAAPAPAGDPRNARLTATAGGASYEALILNGWTDATLVQHGLMA
jgi:hypothetical protein